MGVGVLVSRAGLHSAPQYCRRPWLTLTDRQTPASLLCWRAKVNTGCLTHKARNVNTLHSGDWGMGKGGLTQESLWRGVTGKMMWRWPSACEDLLTQAANGTGLRRLEVGHLIRVNHNDTPLTMRCHCKPTNKEKNNDHSK